jgi:hypothetical protein
MVMAEPELSTRIGRVVRRLQAKPDLLRGYHWDHPDTLDVTGINAAADALGIGPIFAIGEASVWWSWPNLPPDDPRNQVKAECLTVRHPDATEYQIQRYQSELRDHSSLPVAEVIASLRAWAKRAKNLASAASHDTPTGFLGGAALANALGVHATQRDAFFQRLMRQRMSLGDDCWHEVRDPRPNSPRFLYRADSPKLRDLAAVYKNPKSA